MHFSWSDNVLSKFGWVVKSFSIAVIGHKVIRTVIKTERKATTTKILNSGKHRVFAATCNQPVHYNGLISLSQLLCFAYNKNVKM